jgi:hypothetical protein
MSIISAPKRTVGEIGHSAGLEIDEPHRRIARHLSRLHRQPLLLIEASPTPLRGFGCKRMQADRVRRACGVLLDGLLDRP